MNKNKFRVLHSASLLSPPSGIITQMDWEQEAADKLGLDWRVVMYCPVNTSLKADVMHHDFAVDAMKMSNPISKLKLWIKLRYNYHKWLLKQEDVVDVFILRYYVHDPFQWMFVRRCKKPVYFVHHTLEVPELALPGGVSGFVRSNLEKLLGRTTLTKATGIVGVTQEIVDYEIARAGLKNKSTYVYPNGISYKEIMLDDKRTKDVPELLFVANFAPWHGLDLLLESIKNSQQRFILHLVGDIPESLMNSTKDSRIKFHGRLKHDQIVNLSQQCWVGLSSFALKRKEMKSACPLKVREYLMLGLPVYGDYIDVFPEDVSYFKKGNDDIGAIVEFAYATRTISKKSISEDSREYIDKKNLLNVFFKWIEKEKS